jgi:hypothetical protein
LRCEEIPVNEPIQMTAQLAKYFEQFTKQITGKITDNRIIFYAQDESGSQKLQVSKNAGFSCHDGWPNLEFGLPHF